MLRSSGPVLFRPLRVHADLRGPQILIIGKLVSTEHAPLWAAIEVFLWSLPGIVVLVDSDGAVAGHAARDAAPLRRKRDHRDEGRRALRFTASSRRCLPPDHSFVRDARIFKNRRARTPRSLTEIETAVDQSHQRVQPRPHRFGAASGRRPPDDDRDGLRTAFAGAAARDARCNTINRNTSRRRSSLPIARNSPPIKWTLQNSSLYRFNPDGTTLAEPRVAQQQVEIGENPTDLVKRISNNDPDSDEPDGDRRHHAVRVSSRARNSADT